jgi:hypothetical protein
MTEKEQRTANPGRPKAVTILDGRRADQGVKILDRSTKQEVKQPEITHGEGDRD